MFYLLYNVTGVVVRKIEQSMSCGTVHAPSRPT